MRKLIKKTLNILPFIILLISFILIIKVAVDIKKGETPSLFGRAIFLVVSPSMEDTIMTGDMILINVNQDKFLVDDIISFKKPGDELKIITHRIVEIKEINGIKYFTTKGDNNFESLDWEINFSEDEIIGSYIGKSGFMGSIYQLLFSNGTSILFIGIIIIFVIIGGMEVKNIAKILKEAREKDIQNEKEKKMEAELKRLRKEKAENKEE